MKALFMKNVKRLLAAILMGRVAVPHLIEMSHVPYSLGLEEMDKTHRGIGLTIYFFSSYIFELFNDIQLTFSRKGIFLDLIDKIVSYLTNDGKFFFPSVVTLVFLFI